MALRKLYKIEKNKAKLNQYEKILSVDGRHPLQEMIAGLGVNYLARTRPNGKLRYFNFNLAKEMGLIPKDHVEALNPELEQSILDSFAIQIVNEYDLSHPKFKLENAKTNPYMATRYLQLQHPNKLGKTSGDGRSIWNGCAVGEEKVWDVSSCGTGATCLSPAAALQNKFFKTGDPSISYGCGYSDLDEGFGNALFSEILHLNGIPTERTLAVIEFPGRLSINVRASETLIRPSHLLVHLKQKNWLRAKAIADYLIHRMVENKVWNVKSFENKPYINMTQMIAKTFGDMCARFESEYIFCWLDWDGDNILCDGKIIDYGSIRQFGLFHREYRYDDVERWSTNILEQKTKAKYIVQQLAQLSYFLETKKIKPLDDFKRGACVEAFEKSFEESSFKYLLQKLGFNPYQVEILLQKKYRKKIEMFKESFSYFERMTSRRKIKKTADGITKDALFCMRDYLRELPKHIQTTALLMDPSIAMKILRSKYCSKHEARLNSTRKKHLKKMESLYRWMLAVVSKETGQSFDLVLAVVAQRSLQINRSERITGDAISFVQDVLLRKRNQLSFNDMYAVMKEFIQKQMLNPDIRLGQRVIKLTPKEEPRDKLIKYLQEIIREHKHGL